MAYRDIPSVDTLGEAGDIAAPIGSREWAIAVRGELSICLSDEASNRWRIKQLTELLQESKGYERLSNARGKPFASWRLFCVAPAPWGLNYDPDLLDAVIDEYNQPVALRVGQAAERTNGEVKGIGQRGEIGPGPISRNERAKENGVSPTTQKRLDYLARNAPDLREAVERREIGAHKAYDQARGNVKIEIPADVDGAARALREKFKGKDYNRLVDLLAQYIAVDVQ